jgi:hypothetical protein
VAFDVTHGRLALRGAPSETARDIGIVCAKMLMFMHINPSGPESGAIVCKVESPSM